MAELFLALPVQRPPTQIVLGRHALVRCDGCDGAGKLSDDVGWWEWCTHCNGGGVRLLAVKDE